MKPTYIIYGIPKGETERYTEDILSCHSHSQADISAVKKAATLDGWHSFRVVLQTNAPPDFAGTVNS